MQLYRLIVTFIKTFKLYPFHVIDFTLLFLLFILAQLFQIILYCPHLPIQCKMPNIVYQKKEKKCSLNCPNVKFTVKKKYHGSAAHSIPAISRGVSDGSQLKSTCWSIPYQIWIIFMVKICLD